MSEFARISTAGFAATAISFGPARMGFGLFVPELQSDYSVSVSTIGFIASLGFFGFFIGLLIALFMLNRFPPQVPVLTGLAASTIGFGVVALSTQVGVLAFGVWLAASSAGFAWSPFNDAVHRRIRDADRPAALSEISTGTGIGIVGAGLLALVAVRGGLDWRSCWAIFAGVSAVAMLVNWFALRDVDQSPAEMPVRVFEKLTDPLAIPMFAVAIVFGIVTAIYVSFAPDHFARPGGPAGLPSQLAPAVVFMIYGLCGLSGLLTQRVKTVLGLPQLLRLLLASGGVSILLVGFRPDNWLGLAVSAGLQGVFVMMTSAVLAFWSERLFPSMPAYGFTAALLATGIGSVIGPAVAGVVTDQIGPRAMFLAVGLLPVLAMLSVRRAVIRERPIPRSPAT